MKPSRNYFGESSFHHSLRNILKRKKIKINEGEDNVSKKKVNEVLESELGLKFIENFPSKEDIGKLKTHFLSKSDYEDFARNLSNKYLMITSAKTQYLASSRFKTHQDDIKGRIEKSKSALLEKITEELKELKKNHTNIFAKQEIVNQYVNKTNEEEATILNTLKDRKKELEKRYEEFGKKSKELEEMNKKIETFENDFTTTLDQIKNDYIKLKTTVMPGKTFQEYEQSHESEFSSTVETEKEKLKTDLLSIANKRVPAIIYETILKDKIIMKIVNFLDKEFTDEVIIKELNNEVAYKKLNEETKNEVLNTVKQLLLAQINSNIQTKADQYLKEEYFNISKIDSSPKDFKESLKKEAIEKSEKYIEKRVQKLFLNIVGNVERSRTNFEQEERFK